MKKFFYFLVLLPAVVFCSFSGDDTRYPGGAPAGYTGSPADGRNCTQCHGGNASTVLGWITSDIDSSGYIPGQTYTITVTVTGAGRKGFEVSPQDLSGNLLGTLIAGQGNKLVGNNKYVTQSSASNSNPMIWNFGWTAPGVGTGPVTFYGAFAINESVTKVSELTVEENTGVGVYESVEFPGKIYPNPASDKIYINPDINDPTNVKMFILDMRGGELMKINGGTSSPSGGIFVVPTDQLSDGVYIVSLRDGEKTYTRKIIVSH